MVTTPNTDRAENPAFLPKLLREPLVQFLALAALLFLAQAILVGDDRDIISVDKETQAFLIERRQELILRPLSEDEKRQTIEDYIEEEILVREAIKRGFDNSSQIRRLLLQNMRFFIVGDLPEPSEEELRVFFAENRGAFESPPSLELEHIFFEDPTSVPSALLEQLNAGMDPTSFGDRDLAFGRWMRFMDNRRLIAAFGRETAREILALPVDDTDWHGPFTSERGAAHVVRIVERHPPSLPEFEAARDWIATRWMSTKSRELMVRELETVRQNYRVEVTERGADG